MARCTFCGKQVALHEMATKRTADDEDDPRYYCSSECVREERRIAAWQEGMAELTDALDRVATAMDPGRELIAEH